ncbi:hypothetical protein [Methylobacterium oryzae]|uniref:hypothetical protein n=1 Tax=Methylobacterium oryzae TaxID=334852 RepID=UPI001F263E6C|nr:hypothetical protein [Methylobacterium oryzae]UIN38385.1 hypothetical protein LXM90_30855 [Methylobacterium oryzae]
MAKPPIDALTAQIATQSWMAEWRRAWVRLHPNKECPMLAWEDYSPNEQGLMIRAVRAAIAAATPENVAAVIARRED